MNKPYKIVVDENMPHIDQLFAEYADITKLPGREITANDVKNADALLVRSITQVGQNLLKGSKVKFVGTATIGIDHLDTHWLEQNNIRWASAAGCNAAAVAQYVISAICYWLQNKANRQLEDLTVGIVGAGNVGTELARCLTILGVNFLLLDPPLQRAGDTRDFASMDAIKQCDVISFHVPITRHGEDQTFHLIDADFLKSLSSNQLLINAARGEVADNQALYDYLQSSDACAVVLDVFENEPNIHAGLARLCLLATPHIAGHTLEGKLRGSYMIYQSFCSSFNRPIKINQSEIFPASNKFIYNQQNDIEMLLQIYDIFTDSQKMLAVVDNEMAKHFDTMRKNYVEDYGQASMGQSPRRDYSGWIIDKPSSKLAKLVKC